MKNYENDFQNFLKYKFANDEKQWKPWLNVIAKEYYLLFLENNEHFNKLISSYIKRKKLVFSPSEINKIRTINNYQILFSAIDYNIKDKKISYNEKIILSFREVTDPNEIKNFQLAMEELKSDPDIVENELIKNDKSEKLDGLNYYFNLFLDFRQKEKVREYFFEFYIHENNVETDNAIHNLVINKNIYFDAKS